MSAARCPWCRQADLVEGEGTLDQSGQTHLPARTRECPECGWKEWTPASREWRPNEAAWKEAA